MKKKGKRISLCICSTHILSITANDCMTHSSRRFLPGDFHPFFPSSLPQFPKFDMRRRRRFRISLLCCIHLIKIGALWYSWRKERKTRKHVIYCEAYKLSTLNVATYRNSMVYNSTIQYHSTTWKWCPRKKIGRTKKGGFVDSLWIEESYIDALENANLFFSISSCWKQISS
jgi:hypothetical protein